MMNRIILHIAVASLFAAQDLNHVWRKGRIKQCVTNGVFGRGRTLEENASDAARLGVKGYDLIGPKDWPILRKYGLIPTMAPGFGGTIPDGINLKANHDRLETAMREGIDICAKEKAPNLITLSGNRR